MLPTDCGAILPYPRINSSLFSPIYCSNNLKSSKSINSRFLSLAILNAIARTPSCASDSPSIRDKITEPTLDTVVLIG